MKKSSFVILGVLALAAVLVAWQLGLKPRQADPLNAEALSAGELLLPDFADSANQIEQVEIIGAGNNTLVTLQRGEDHWGIVERGGFPADWSQVRGLLRELGQAEVIAPKTARPENYARLGVADVSTDNTGGGLLRWGSAPDQSLIIGIEPSDLTGRYVRQPEAAQSYLVDQPLEVRTDPRDWIDAAILDWQADRLRSITIRHADGDTVRIQRSNPDALEMNLINIPDGREISGQWAVNGIANSLVSLRADDVRRASGELPDNATRALFETDDGINLVLSLYRDEAPADNPESAAEEGAIETAEGEYLVRFEVTREPQPANSQAVANQDAETDSGAAPSATVMDTSDNQDADPQAEVERLSRRVDGWEFIIPDYKYNSINKRLEDLLKPLPSDSDASVTE